MKRQIPARLLGVLLLCLAVTGMSCAEKAPPARHQLIVQLEQALPSDQIDTVVESLRQQSGQSVELVRQSGTRLIVAITGKLDEATLQQLMEQMATVPGVKQVEPDLLMRPVR